MNEPTIIDFTGRDAVTDPLTDLLRKGARELLQAAVEAERDTFLAAFSERRTADGRAAVVGSGYHPERAIQTGVGPVTVKVPKVRAKDGKPVNFRSALVPLIGGDAPKVWVDKDSRRVLAASFLDWIRLFVARIQKSYFAKIPQEFLQSEHLSSRLSYRSPVFRMQRQMQGLSY